jgi:hypothetical protein
MFECRTAVAGAVFAAFWSLTSGALSAEGGGTGPMPSRTVAGLPARPAQSPVPGAAARQPLGEAVAALEAQHRVRVMDPWGVIELAETQVPVPVGQAAEAAFRALLGDYELLFYYPPAGAEGGGRLAEVWVYPPGMVDRGVVGAPGGREAADRAGDGAERRAALIESAVLSDPATAQAMIVRGLGDPSETVRARTLAVAASMGVTIPRETLLGFLRSDPAEEVRAAAMDALALGASGDADSLREVVEQAQQDPSPLIQSKAAELAATYEPPAEMPEPDPIPEVIDFPPELDPALSVPPAEGGAGMLLQ